MSGRDRGNAPARTLFTNATVVRPAEADVVADARVLVEGDRVVEVGGADVRADAARTIDVAGRFLMPGLVDAHVHVNAATADVTVQADWASADVLRAATCNAARLLDMPGLIGVVAPGAYADLLDVDQNPLDDVTVLARPEQSLRLVMTRGRVHATRHD